MARKKKLTPSKDIMGNYKTHKGPPMSVESLAKASSELADEMWEDMEVLPPVNVKKEPKRKKAYKPAPAKPAKKELTLDEMLKDLV